MASKVEAILDEIKGLTLLEASELVKKMEEAFGVSAAAAAPVAVAGGALLAAASWAAFGGATWQAFFDGIGHAAHSDAFADWGKLQTAFGLVRALGGRSSNVWALEMSSAQPSKYS